MSYYVKHYIRTVPDYPVEGVNFYDMNSLFASDIWSDVVGKMAENLESKTEFLPTHIAGIESRGFVVGAAVADALNIPFVMIRKKGAKYPGKLLEESYELEYGTDTLTLQEGVLGHTSRVVIADDLIATGGSMLASRKLCEQAGAKVLGCVAVINLKYLNTSEFESMDILSGWELLS